MVEFFLKRNGTVLDFAKPQGEIEHLHFEINSSIKKIYAYIFWSSEYTFETTTENYAKKLKQRFVLIIFKVFSTSVGFILLQLINRWRY